MCDSIMFNFACYIHVDRYKKTGSVLDRVYILKISAIDYFKFKCYLKINFEF